MAVEAGSGRDLQIARMNAGLMTTTVMSAVVVFLAGALLVAPSHRPEGALMLLATSALGFIFATLLYANTYAWLLEPPDRARFYAQIHRANVVSECFGVYCLLIAVPPTVVSVTSNQSLRWFVAVITLLTLVGYQLSGASLLQHYLARHTSRWRRVVVGVIGWAFTFLLVSLGSWVFLAALDGGRGRLIPVFVLVAFLLVTGLYAMWAEPLPTRHAHAAISTEQRGGVGAADPGPQSAGQPPLPTNAPPWAAAQAGREQRRERAKRGVAGWILQVLMLLLIVATLVAVLVSLHDQHDANARAAQTARQGQAAALSSMAALEGQVLEAQHGAVVTTAELTAKVYVIRIGQAIGGLLDLLRTHRELPPAIPISDLHVSVAGGVAILRTNASANVLADLSNFFGQMRITYGNFRLGRRPHKLTPLDHVRVCRTIKFGRVAELDFRGVPRVGVSPDARLKLPAECR